MAIVLPITVKRYNGTDWDTLNPKTTIAQVEDLQTELNNKINTTLIGAVSGVASLDGAGKVPEAQLPSSVFGGMRYVGALASGGASASILGIIDTYVENNGGTRSGCYVIASSIQTITMSVDHALTINAGAGGEEGDSVGSITLEPGDWLIYDRFEASTHIWGVVNNTYQDAGDGVKGVVTLGIHNLKSALSGTGVVNENNLNAILTDVISGLADVGHNHDTAYLGLFATASSANKLANSRVISLSGDATGSVAFDGQVNADIVVTVDPSKHDHVYIGSPKNYFAPGDSINGIVATLDAKLFEKNNVWYTDDETLLSPETGDFAFVY